MIVVQGAPGLSSDFSRHAMLRTPWNVPLVTWLFGARFFTGPALVVVWLAWNWLK